MIDATPRAGGIIGGAFDGTPTYAIGRVAKNVFVTGGETPDAEQPKEIEVFEVLSELLFTREAGKYDDLFWGTLREPRDRPSSRD